MLRSERRGEKSCMLLAQKKNRRNLGEKKEMLLKNTQSCINIGNVYVVLLCGTLVIHIQGCSSETAKAI